MPSPSSGTLGGVAAKTRETMLLCEAAGFDVILVETVGVGQSETAVADLTDFFLVLMLPNAGDELQGIKKGIIELADMLAVNKADGEGATAARAAAAQYKAALHILAPASTLWSTPVVTICRPASYRVLKVWNISSWEMSLPAINCTSSMRRMSAERYFSRNSWFRLVWMACTNSLVKLSPLM